MLPSAKGLPAWLFVFLLGLMGVSTQKRIDEGTAAIVHRDTLGAVGKGIVAIYDA